MATSPAVLSFKATRRIRGVNVTISRGDDSVAVRAVLGRSDWPAIDGVGNVHRLATKDFIVLASEFVLAGKTTLPEPGDLFEVVLASCRYRFEMLPGDGQQCYSMVDPEGHCLIRCHTKEIDVDRPGAFDQAFSEEFE